MKNEAKNMREWLWFHKIVYGVDRVVFYNDGSTDDFRHVISDFIEGGLVEIVDVAPVKVRKVSGNSTVGARKHAMISQQIKWFSDCVHRYLLFYTPFFLPLVMSLLMFAMYPDLLQQRTLLVCLI